MLTSVDLMALALCLYHLPNYLLSLWHDHRGSYPSATSWADLHLPD